MEETVNAHRANCERKISREADLFRPESKEGNQPGGCTLVVEG